MLKKKIWANCQRIIELFTQKFVNQRFRIRIPDPGVKKAPEPGSESAKLLFKPIPSFHPAQSFIVKCYMSGRFPGNFYNLFCQVDWPWSPD